MKYIIDIKEAAKAGLFEAFDYYENKQEGLGDKFLDDWETHLNIIKENPLLF